MSSIKYTFLLRLTHVYIFYIIYIQNVCHARFEYDKRFISIIYSNSITLFSLMANVQCKYLSAYL